LFILDSITYKGLRNILRRKLKMNREKAFTLIELLVVISIIALLVSIMLPALSRTRAVAKKIVCLNNLRNLGLGIEFYLQENNQIFPPDRDRANLMPLQIGQYVRNRPRWPWFIDYGVGHVINPGKYASQEEFDQALEMDNDYFVCPTMNNSEYARDIRNGSYGFNYQYLSCTRNNHCNFPNKATNVRSPMTTILFGDSRGAGIPHGQHAYCMDPPRMAVSRGSTRFSPAEAGIVPIGGADRYSPASARHLSTASIVFMDGHTKAMTYEEMGYHVDPTTKRPIEKKVNQIDNLGNNRMWTGLSRDEPAVNVTD
jgi:prepilin-type N-terminal cleavage/methylation domain-containing protein